MEHTLAITKNHAVDSTHLILAEAQRHGLRVAHLQFTALTPDQVERLYALHVGEPYWPRLRDSVTGDVGLAVLEGDDAVKRWRDLMGATDPAQAEEGTIRCLFGNKEPGMMAQNAVHGSDSVEAARREIAIVFPEFAGP
jgi:nucleoside-diphosphate kinase